ncbi:MAG: DUF721 domain-containing protein [Ignavibacteria bacterium]
MAGKRINTKLRDNKVSCLVDEINNISEVLGVRDRENELKIFNVWKECVGETISKFATPSGIKNNKLLVNVENPVWRFELNNRKEEIIKKLNSELQGIKSKTLIKEIVFV